MFARILSLKKRICNEGILKKNDYSLIYGFPSQEPVMPVDIFVRNELILFC